MTEIISQEIDTLNDNVPGVGKIRALCCTLKTKDGRTAYGLSVAFRATEAVAQAYQMLMNTPIIGGHVVMEGSE